MKKSTSFILFFCFLLFITACKKEDYTIPDNLLLGMSFEEPNLHPSIASFSLSSDNYTLERTNTEAFDGEQSLMIKSNTIQNNQFAYWLVRIYDFEVGTTPTLKIRIKAEDIEGEGFLINMFGREKDTFETVNFGSLTTKTSTEKNDWETFEIKMNKPLTDQVSQIDIYLFLLGGTQGTVYYDKFELTAD